MKPVRLLATVVALGAAIMITAAACSGNSNSGSTTSSPGSSTTAESVKLTVLGAASTRVVRQWWFVEFGAAACRRCPW